MAKEQGSDGGGRGEERLREWGVGDDLEALRAAWGRDADADLAIAARLGRHTDAAAAAALVELAAAAASKALRKELRRSLFRLQQRGVVVPEQPREEPLRLGPPPIEGYMSPSDGAGDQFFWLLRPVPGGIVHLYAVVNDPLGMREAELNVVTRKAIRHLREDLQRKHEIRIVEVDWQYCDYRMAQAWRWAGERGTQVTGDYPRLRTEISTKPPPEQMPHPIFAALDRDAVAADESLLATSDELLREPELRTWFFTQDELRSLLERIRDVEESPLVLNEAQKAERIDALVTEAVSTEFGGEKQASIARQLLDMAWVFHASQRRDAARRALAVARALESSPRGGAGIPFCETLLRSSIVLYLRAERAQEVERAQSSLIVTPHQARAELQQRRR